jgi:hypothetical protein
MNSGSGRRRAPPQTPDDGPSRESPHPSHARMAVGPAGHFANPSGGYVRIPREMLDPQHPFAPSQTGDPVTKQMALIDFLGMAAWEDGHHRERGEVLGGTRWLEDRWGWSRSTVRRFLVTLEDAGAISWVRGRKKGEPSRFLIVGFLQLQRGPGAYPNPRHQTVARSLSSNDRGYRDPVAPIAGTNQRPGDATPTKVEATKSYQGGTGKVGGAECVSCPSCQLVKIGPSQERCTRCTDLAELDEWNMRPDAIRPDPDEDGEAFERWAIENEDAPC